MSTIYIHWPFCLKKCDYCSFYSVTCPKDLDLNLWLSAYERVLKKHLEEFYNNEEITSIYFGGGTPSLVPSYFVADILCYIDKYFKVCKQAEITIEANPGTINCNKLKDYKDAGVNRLSIGVQSLVDESLKILGRIHTSNEAIKCIHEASEVFDNVSADFIYNRPGQTLPDWQDELHQICKLPVKHLSLYELIVEDNTPICKQIDSCILPKQNETSEFFEETCRIANKYNFNQYEVSNFAKSRTNNETLPTYYSRHNMSYWNYEDYYAVGPSAHSRITKNGCKIAIEQIANNSLWLTWSKHPVFECEPLDKFAEYKERLIMGLRTTHGIKISDIDEKIQKYYGLKNKLEKLIENSYIIIDGDVMTLSYQGRLRLNLIVQYLSRELQ